MVLLLSFATIQAQTAGEGIDVTHYEIHVGDFDFANRTLQGETHIEFTVTANNITTIVLELKSLTVSDVDCDFTDVQSFSQEGDFLTINLAEALVANENATLIVRYGGNTFSETWGGVEWWGTDYVYNLGVGFDSQPHNLGKTWFPCVDNFTDKASYDVYVTTTNDKKAICGGEFVETIDNGDGTSTWHWVTPQEIATYHISFAVGEYDLWEDVYHGIERDIPIEVYAKPSQMNNVRRLLPFSRRSSALIPSTASAMSVRARAAWNTPITSPLQPVLSTAIPQAKNMWLTNCRTCGRVTW